MQINNELFTECNLKLRPIFTALWEKTKRPVLRRPPISVRLLNIPRTHKLVVLPLFQFTTKEIDPAKHLFELMREEIRGANRKWTRRLCLVNKAEVKLTRWYKATVEEDLRITQMIMEYFATDSQAVFARSFDNCSVCGRCLTDGLSKARGIGPECVKYLPIYEFKTNSSIMEAV